ncbi:hypothetical protein DFJ77DRAFT_457526 [Powellomyces hirtus]|nr:hypothetical protein DFJ77DRAFT_457526 [Powellomyces hirtus]
MRKGKQSLKLKYKTISSFNKKNPLASASSSSTAPCNDSDGQSSRSVQELMNRSHSKTRCKGANPELLDTKVGSIYALYQQHEENVVAVQKAALFRSVAGPAPPPTWRAAWPARPAGKEEDSSRGNAEGDRPPVHSLQSLCVQVIARNLRSYKPRIHEFRLIPFHLKENIMQYMGAARISPIVNDTLPLFRDPEMRVVTLANSSVDVKGLAMLLNVPVSVTADEYIGGNATIPTVSLSRAPSPEPASSWEDLDTSEPVSVIQSIVPVSPVHSLSIAYTSRMAAVPFAYLVGRVLPSLMYLNLSVCFDSVHGPSALGILSRKLTHLKHLDLSYCKWVSLQLIANVGWELYWKELEVLVLKGCDESCHQVKNDLKGIRPSLQVLV